MTAQIEALQSLEDLVACERLQRRLLGERAGAAAVGVPALRAISEAGGLLLGVRADRVTHELSAAAVSLRSEVEGFRALFSLWFAVAEEARGQGIGVALRLAERRAALDAGIEVIRAWVDPLAGRESHIAWNRIGAIGTGYEQDVFGDLGDRIHRGMATDRVRAEWWLRSPRTIALIDEGRSAAHLRVGLHEMVVATRTTPGPGGQRTLVDVRTVASAANVLIEIPADIHRLRDADPAEARRWRLGTREVFERLLAAGYLLVGLVHEGGRCFQLLEKAERFERPRTLGGWEERMNRSELAARIDHTLLGPGATRGAVERLCAEAVRFGVASVCVDLRHAATAKKALEGSSVLLCVVVGFPSGMTATSVKAFETREAIATGADEVDMVIPVGVLKERDLVVLRADIAAVCAVAHGAKPRATVKVILETCLLTDEEKEIGAREAVAAGADYVKTSTGFGSAGATVADVALLRRVVGPEIGVKAAGGIRDTATALAMIAAGATRIGASRTGDILAGLAEPGSASD